MKITKFVLASVALLLLYDTAYACRCRQAKASADISGPAAVFSGRVVEIKIRQPPYEIARFTITFEVERVWKGEAKRSITLVTRANTCDFRFREGESYLVFASPSRDGRGLTTHACSRTGLLANRKEDLELLGEGKAPEEDGT